MALRELVSSLLDSASVRRVLGEPIERDGVLVIPVANVRGAFGGGEGSPAAADTEQLSGWGGGGAWSATPAGTYVLRNGEMGWVPAVDANRTILLGCLTGIVSLLVARSMIRTLLKR
ncbi:MAG: spore germination protein GerW family protein [Candidatus Limnocylindrales bacterium]